MLNLSNVSLVIVDTINLDRALIAVDKCTQAAKFAEIRVLSTLNIWTIQDYSEFILRSLKWYVKSEFVLLVQWDGFIVKPSAWNPEFLHYDYIGAPWWYEGQHNVGNGGFSLRSKKMLEATASMNFDHLHPEDDVIRLNAETLKSRYGIKFAPESLAAQFSWEGNGKYPSYNGSFGFHGASNVNMFL